MKYLLRTLVPAILLLGLTCAFAQGQGRLATIDLRKTFDNYWKTKQADASLKERAADMEKEHKNMLEDYRKAREEYQKMLSGANDQAVSQDERDKRKKTAEERLKYLKGQEETITQYERQARTTLDEQRRRMRENILTEVRTIVNAKAKAAGFSLVVDSAAESFNSTPFMLYNAGENDITESVLSQLNATAPADASRSSGTTNAPAGNDRK